MRFATPRMGSTLQAAAIVLVLACSASSALGQWLGYSDRIFEQKFIIDPKTPVEQAVTTGLFVSGLAWMQNPGGGGLDSRVRDKLAGHCAISALGSLRDTPAGNERSRLQALCNMQVLAYQEAYRDQRSSEAQVAQLRDYIHKTYGAVFLPDEIVRDPARRAAVSQLFSSAATLSKLEPAVQAKAVMTLGSDPRLEGTSALAARSDLVELAARFKAAVDPLMADDEARQQREAQRNREIEADRSRRRQMEPLLAQIRDQIIRCWQPPVEAAALAKPPIVRMRLAIGLDGSLIEAPKAVDPGVTSLAKLVEQSAVRATQRCSPLRIPAEYRSYYPLWRDLVVDFDSSESGGGPITSFGQEEAAMAAVPEPRRRRGTFDQTAVDTEHPAVQRPVTIAPVRPVPLRGDTLNASLAPPSVVAKRPDAHLPEKPPAAAAPPVSKQMVPAIKPATPITAMLSCGDPHHGQGPRGFDLPLRFEPARGRLVAHRATRQRPGYETFEVMLDRGKRLQVRGRGQFEGSVPWSYVFRVVGSEGLQATFPGIVEQTGRDGVKLSVRDCTIVFDQASDVIRIAIGGLKAAAE